MPSVQDGLNPRNIAHSKRKAGSASHAEDDSLPAPVRKRKYQPSENGPSNLDPFTIRVRSCECFRSLEG